MPTIEIFELGATVGRNLVFRGRNDRVRMLAEQHATKPLVREESRSGALDFQFFEFLAALALEFVFRERCIAREVGQKFEQLARKLGEARSGDRARIGSRMRSKVRAHAPQIFLDLAARPRSGSCANDAGREVGKPRRGVRNDGVAASEEKLRRNLRERARLGENHLQAVAERSNGSLRPRDGALGGERRRGDGTRVCCGGSAHWAAPFATGFRTSTARFCGTRSFRAAA